MHPHALYPYPHIYPQPPGQLEATNLTLPSSSRSKQGEKQKDEESRVSEDKKERDCRSRVDVDERKETQSADQCLDYSKNNGVQCDKKRARPNKTDDTEKIKSSLKVPQNTSDTSSKHHTDPFNDSTCKSATSVPDRKRHLSDSSLKRELYGNSKTDNSSHGIHSLHSPPQRHKVASSPEQTSNRERYPDRKYIVRSPYETFKPVVEQDVPENLCIKDRRKEKSDKETKSGSKMETSVVKTLTVDTTTTVTVSSTLNIITSDIGYKDRTYKRKGKLSFHASED